MVLGRWAAMLSAAAALGCVAHSALALVAIPEGTPFGSATDVLTLNGVYTPPLPSPPTPPFAAPNFTLSLTIPAQVSVAPNGPVVTAFVLDNISGSYTNGGETTNFSDDFVVFGSTDTSLSTAEYFSMVVSNLLVPADSFVLSFQADTPLFSPATFASGVPVTFTPGSFTVVIGSSSATYDPGFSGAGTISRQVTVPEPASVSVLLAALVGLRLARRWHLGSSRSRRVFTSW